MERQAAARVCVLVKIRGAGFHCARANDQGCVSANDRGCVVHADDVMPSGFAIMTTLSARDDDLAMANKIFTAIICDLSGCSTEMLRLSFKLQRNCRGDCLTQVKQRRSVR